MSYTYRMTEEQTNSSRTTADIEAMLRKNGIYPTAQRLAIANVLFSENQHVTAEQLHETLYKSGNRISIATIYNTLGLFVKKSLLREIFIDGGKTFFDSNNSHHHHCYNIDTGNLVDLSDQLVPHINMDVLPLGTAVETIDIIVRVRNSN